MKFQPVILFLATIFFFYSCEKEYSVENGDTPPVVGTSGGTAIYTFAGGSSNCTDAVISGTYTAGAVLSSSNTVSILVNVDSIGTYTLSSSSANGISFSGSGTFTSTGPQTITLTGNGTPAVSGTYSYLPGTNGCNFSITVSEGSTTSAVFSFDGGTGACAGALINGGYTEGTAVTAANTVTLKVNVTTPGSYSITSESINGISFIGAGNFTSAGAQNLILTSTGTPTTSGDFNYKAGANGCEFTITVESNGSSITDYYFDVTIDGEKIVKHAEDSPTGYGLGYGTSGFDDVVYSSIISPTTDPLPLGMPYLAISKGLFIGSLSATEESFKNYFLPGNYLYATPGSYEGIDISWVDKNAKEWHSSSSPGTQTGSNFSIESSEGYHDLLGNYVVKFTATFNCKLYDDAGNSITLTNGKFVGEFQK
jgi:hypothetical protein